MENDFRKISPKFSSIVCLAFLFKRKIKVFFQSEDLDKIRYALTQSEHQCHLLRLELQRVQTEKEILKVQLVEQKMSGKSEVDIRLKTRNFY